MFIDAIQSSRSQIDRILKLKLRFSKCTVIMGRDHGHPYILSTTVLSIKLITQTFGIVTFGKWALNILLNCEKQIPFVMSPETETYIS